jgi:transposase
VVPLTAASSAYLRLIFGRSPPDDAKALRTGGVVMDVVVKRCAGLDVHRDNVVATVRVPSDSDDGRRWVQTTKTFRATIAGLAELRDWLAGFAVTRVGMEATGVYWKTVFQALEERFECWLLNAQHMRNVPGRKTDVKDSEWICQLVDVPRQVVSG